MQASRFIEIVGKNGNVQINVDKPVGTRIEIIVLDLADQPLGESLAASKLQESTGFVKNVLANSKEDVWNDL